MRFFGSLLFLSLALARIAPPQIRPEAETQIVVETSPDARIFLDGGMRGQAPRSGTFVIRDAKPGTHEVRVETPGKHPFVQKVTVSAGQVTTVQAKLADYTGDLEVFTVPQAEVLLNGRAAGKADGSGRLFVRGLRVLTYTVRASLAGYDPAEQRIELAPDIVSSVTLDLKRVEVLKPSGIPPPSFTKYRRLLGHEKELYDIRDLFFQPGGQLVSWSGRIIVWDSETGRQLQTIDIDPQHYFITSHDLRWVAFSYYYSDSNTNRSAFIETERAHQMWERQGQVELTPEIAGAAECFSPDSKRLAIVNRPSEGVKDGTVELWDLESGHRIQTWRDPSIRRLAYSPDGKWIATGRTSVVLWDAATGNKIRELPKKAGGILRLFFSDDSRWVAALSTSYVEFWEVATGRAGRVVDASGVNSPEFYDAVFTHDGNYLISSRNPGIYIWDLATGQQVGKPLEQTRGRLALSPDGRWLAVAADHELTMWRRTE